MAIDPAIVSHRFYWLSICHEADKASGPLIACKEKRKKHLSRGNSVALVLFLFVLSLFLAFRIFCLFAFFV